MDVTSEITDILEQLDIQKKPELVERNSLIEDRNKIIFLFRRDNESIDVDYINTLFNKVLED